MITLAMQDALASMRAHGHLELRPRLQVWTVPSEPDPPEWFISRLTARALVQQGLAVADDRGLQLTARGKAEAAAQAVRR